MAPPFRANSAAIFQVIRPQVPKALLAHTAAEVLFWLQYAQHEMDGRPAIYKTGPELSEKLGISARTANQHLKLLAEAGFWKLVYRPKPGGISQVTWVIPSHMALSVINEATYVLREERRPTRRRESDVAHEDERGLTRQETDSRKSSVSTTLQRDKQRDLQRDDKENFIRSPGKGRERTKFDPENRREVREERKRKNVGKNREEDEEGEDSPKPPMWMEIEEADQKFVQLMGLLLKERELPPWDYSSQYTWKHSKWFRWGLVADGLAGDDEHLKKTLIRLLTNWPTILSELPSRYKHHKGNQSRPTPRVLNDAGAEIRRHLRMEAMPTKHKNLGVDFDKVGLDFNEVGLDG